MVVSVGRRLDVIDRREDHLREPSPHDVVVGTLDQFVAPGTLEIIGRMRGVTTHRVNARQFCSVIESVSPSWNSFTTFAAVAIVKSLLSRRKPYARR